MTADKHEMAADGNVAAEIQGAAKGKFLRLDLNDPTIVLPCDGEAFIRRSGVNDDGLTLVGPNRLPLDGAEELRQITGLVESADNNAGERQGGILREEVLQPGTLWRDEPGTVGEEATEESRGWVTLDVRSAPELWNNSKAET